MVDRDIFDDDAIALCVGQFNMSLALLIANIRSVAKTIYLIPITTSLQYVTNIVYVSSVFWERA